MEVEARQPLGEREQSVGWSHLTLWTWVHLPKSTDLWKQSDIISRSTYALLQSHFLPLQISQRCMETQPGPWGQWAVGGGPWLVSPWQAGLHPLATTWLLEPSWWCQEIAFGLTSFSEGPCHHLPKGFVGVLENGSKPKLPSLHILKMLSLNI